MPGLALLAGVGHTPRFLSKPAPTPLLPQLNGCHRQLRSRLRAEKKTEKRGDSTDVIEVDESVSDVSDALVEMGAPILNNLGFSGAAGLSVAIAIKVVGSIAAAAIGITFVLLQVLSYYGVIDIKWKVMESNLVDVLDANGDGKLDQKDAKIILDRGLGFLSQGVPSVAGFCTGFLLGINIF